LKTDSVALGGGGCALKTNVASWRWKRERWQRVFDLRMHIPNLREPNRLIFNSPNKKNSVAILPFFR
jgi:hypothetical protein